jgi:hypothetical protein
VLKRNAVCCKAKKSELFAYINIIITEMARTSIRILVLIVMIIFLLIYVFLNYFAINAKSYRFELPGPMENFQSTAKLALSNSSNNHDFKNELNRNATLKSNAIDDINLKTRSTDLKYNNIITNKLVSEKYLSLGSHKNRADIAYSLDLLKSGRCKHIYLDLGTNIGNRSFLLSLITINCTSKLFRCSNSKTL